MSRQSEPADPDAGRIRLQKVLASAGIASRRASEELIAAGRVTVNGDTVAELGSRVDPNVDVIRVDGDRINLREDLVYLALNKPRGVMSAMSDSRGRATVGDLVADRPERLFHVGRLDVDSEGLLLLTNDGDLGHRLMHPSFGVSKTYLATVPGPVPAKVGRTLRAGVILEDGPARADAFRVVQTEGGRAIVEIVLHEGRKHIVRRMLAEVGHPVQRLVRTAIGPVLLGGQRAGTVRPLTRAELAGLYKLVDQPGPAGAGKIEGSNTDRSGAGRGGTRNSRSDTGRRRRPSADPGRDDRTRR
jgi:23S rRNA pseudouridine2605 synthase